MKPEAVLTCKGGVAALRHENGKVEQSGMIGVFLRIGKSYKLTKCCDLNVVRQFANCCVLPQSYSGGLRWAALLHCLAAVHQGDDVDGATGEPDRNHRLTPHGCCCQLTVFESGFGT